MAAVGDLFSAATYNAVVTKINTVLGAGDGAQQGYGRAVKSSAVGSGTVISSALMDNLYDDLVKARTHQKGSANWDTSADGLNSPDAGEYIGAFAADLGSGGTSADATVDEDEGFLDFEQAAQDILDDQYDVAAAQTALSSIDTSTITSAWNGTITHSVDVVFANADERRYFFNSGGYLQFDASLTGGNSVAGDQTATYPSTPAYQKDEIWQTMLNTMGSIRISRTATTSTGTGTGTSIGNYDLTTTYQTIFTKSGSGVYSENFYKVEARVKTNATNTLQFLITFADSDLGDNRDADLGFPGQGTPVDENVTGTTTSTVSSRAATGLGIEHPSAATTSELDGGGAGTSYVLTANDTTINEGGAVVITLTTTGVPNGTNVPYTITGINAADLTSGSITGNFTINSNSASISFGLANDLTTEGEETLTLALNNSQDSIDITIADTSKGAVYSLSASSSTVNEGSSLTFTLDTENVSAGTNIAYSITGINAADLSQGSLTGNMTVIGSYETGSASTTITLAADGATEGAETITFSAAGLSTQVTVNDTSASSVSAWPTEPLAGWGSATRVQQATISGDYNAQAFARLNITNDFSNNRITLDGRTGTDAAFAPANVGYITYSGYSNPTIEVRYFQSNVQITSVGDEDSVSPAERTVPNISGTWYTIANNDSEQFNWLADESRYLGQTQGQGGAAGTSVAIVNADSVSFEVRISQSGLPTITRTSPVKSVRLSADLYTGAIQ